MATVVLVNVRDLVHSGVQVKIAQLLIIVVASSSGFILSFIHDCGR